MPIPSNPKHFTFKGDRSVIVDGLGNGLTLSKTIRGPCKRCNNEWMGDLENIAQRLLLSMMKGDAQTLDRVQQRTLATWLAVKSMVWENQHNVRWKSVPETDREFIYSNREAAAWRLPEDWYVWIGRSDAVFGSCGAFHVGACVVYEKPDGTVWPNPTEALPATVHCFALFSGAFLAVVLRTPFSGDGQLFSKDGSEMLQPVWPISKDRCWPPSFTFPAKDVWTIPQTLIDIMVEALRDGSQRS